MALSPQKFREIVFQLLYSQELARPESELMTELMMNELAITKKNVRLAQDRVLKIQERLQEIDALISSASTSYEFNRIQLVTKNILRIGVFELFFDDQIPPKVAIAEAIRLSRKFCTPESASFVNALLDHLFRKKQGEPIEPKNVSTYSQVLLESEIKEQEANQTLSLSTKHDPSKDSKVD